MRTALPRAHGTIKVRARTALSRYVYVRFYSIEAGCLKGSCVCSRISIAVARVQVFQVFQVGIEAALNMGLVRQRLNMGLVRQRLNMGLVRQRLNMGLVRQRLEERSDWALILISPSSWQRFQATSPECFGL